MTKISFFNLVLSVILMFSNVGHYVSLSPFFYITRFKVNRLVVAVLEDVTFPDIKNNVQGVEHIFDIYQEIVHGK